MIHVLFKIVAVVLLATLIGVVAAALFRSYHVQHDRRQQLFLKGTFPDPLPDGLYKGDIGRAVSWKGKEFEQVKARGINVFEDGKKYQFITYPSQGLTDRGVKVLRVDYNISGNPFWLRTILDEVVQVAPNEYLGKMHVRIIPGLPFSLGYFRLQK